ncbi:MULTISPECIES: HAMP domain-containing protein [Rhodopseudomonas]|uniref:Histidine kinase HAMP region domain protein n=1 Tax=Rhodopseudomonas palustris (strain DX-1) TaxID=652103 RepID=E6VIY6_RHOPX|nr:MULTISPECIES: HAMP domain-containing protein [Rhodopseudomonas]NEW88437.1 HAMP domain-containing protein [Rhodopseudomonas sp. WA056]QDL99626.1 methyl-accepting chemotaxis protein [Rhodopseudomonas palustris]
MQFDLSNRNLAQKISILVLGITLFASVAIGGVGEMVLHKVTDSHAKQSARVASLDRLVGQGGATLSPVRAADGSIVGMLVMQQDSGPVVMPASFEGQGLVVQASETVVTSTPDYGVGAARTMLLLAGIAVFAVVGLVGTRISRGLLAPLGELEKDVERLASGDTSVRIHALSRSDEIGRIARSIAKIQQSLIELAKLKSHRVLDGTNGILANLKEMWMDLKGAVSNAREMLFTDGRTVSETLSRSWSNWLHNGLGVPKRA